MFTSFPQSVMNAWTNFPMMGPNREYLIKIQGLQTSWSNFLQSNIEYSQLAQIFWGYFFQELPQYWQKTLQEVQNTDPTQKMQKATQFIDQCWEKTMKSDEYAKKSGEFLNNLGDFRAKMLDFFTPMLHESNIASQQQIHELAKQVDELRKKMEEFESQS